MRILIVEDDLPLAQTLQRAFQQVNYYAEYVQNAEAADSVLRTEVFDLIVLDWMLPDMSGLQLLRKLRRLAFSVPVLMLTANISTRAKIEGLDAGADDYLAKPFDLDELLARVRALGRRNSVRPDAKLVYSELALDLDLNLLTVNNKHYVLSVQECRVMKLLMDQQGAYVSKARLETYLSSWEEPITPNAIEALVSRLRKKIGNAHIKTLRGVGYKVN